MASETEEQNPGTTPTAEYVIRYQGLAGTSVRPSFTNVGDYLEWYDPDRYEGQGSAKWTADIDHARLFPSAEAAMACWQAQSLVRPLRADGQPNRPLTAITVSVERAPPSPGIPPL